MIVHFIPEMLVILFSVCHMVQLKQFERGSRPTSYLRQLVHKCIRFDGPTSGGLDRKKPTIGPCAVWYVIMPGGTGSL